MTMELTAGLVVVGELPDLESYAVSLAENADGSGWALVFLISDEFDEQDVAQGLNTYNITSHEGITHYGGVVQWQREGDRIDLEVDDATAEELGLESVFTLVVADDATADEVETGLRRVLG